MPAMSLLVFEKRLWGRLRYRARSRRGRWMASPFGNPSGAGRPASDRVSREEPLLSPCHPIGVALFEGRRTGVVAESGFREAGNRARVLGWHDGRWIVEAVA